jgi:hypothetical protein
MHASVESSEIMNIYTGNITTDAQSGAVRHDVFAKAHPLVVEEAKEARLHGFYVHPELYGAPDEKQTEWARHPEMMKRLKEKRAMARPTIKAVAQAQTLHTPE